MGILLDIVEWCAIDPGASAWTAGSGLSAAIDSGVADNAPALRAVDVADISRARAVCGMQQRPADSVQRGGITGGTAADVPGATALGAGFESLRPDRGGNRCDLLGLPAGRGRERCPDRPPGGKHADLPVGSVHAAGAGRGGRRAVHRWSWRSAGVFESAAADGGALCEGPVQRCGRSAALSDRRPGPVAGGREHRISGTQRPTGQDAGISHRAGGDRVAAGAARGRRGSGRVGARGHAG